MTQEEKSLLLQDLCGRLPYGVKTEYIKTKKQYRLHELSEDGNYFSLVHETEATGVCSELGIEYKGEQIIKPYLRPMSSMADEEWEDYQKIRMIDWVHGDINGTFINAGLIVDWLNSHHFDYRGLIPKGLAIDCTNLNIY